MGRTEGVILTRQWPEFLRFTILNSDYNLNIIHLLFYHVIFIISIPLSIILYYPNNIQYDLNTFNIYTY